MHEGHLLSDFLLKAEVGSFVIPFSDGSRNSIHRLDVMHNPGWKAGQEIGDQSGGIFGFIVLGTDNVKFELVDIVLELFSRVDVGGGEPVHGFLGGVNISKSFLKSCSKVTKVLKDWLANPCWW